MVTIETVGPINWNEFGSDFVVLEDSEATDLTLGNWSLIEKDFAGIKKKGLSFSVNELDGKVVSKKFETFSKKLIKLLKVRIIESEKQDKKSFKVRITRNGLGLNTTFVVKDLS